MDKNIQGFIEKYKAYIPDDIVSIIGSYAFSFLMAILIFFIGKWIARRVTNLLVSVLRKVNGMDETLIQFLENIVYYILLVVVILTALSELGVETTSFLAILGAAGLAIGLALKDSLGNFASGVMIILFKPFRLGDFIKAAGESGTVEDISIFTTVLRTPDNQKIIIPNGEITSGSITNVNAKETRRIDLIIGIGYDDDIKKAKNVLINIIEKEQRVLHQKGITVAVGELADSSVNFVVRAWVNTPDYWDVKFDLIEEIKLTFDNEGISIPYPQQDVHHYNKD